jgi:galactose mutarotase-like enzyme
LSSYFDKEASREIIWQGDPNHWKRQAPVLFPIIGKVENNSYLFEKKTYKLNQHGFARDKKFKVINQSGSSILFKTSSSSKTKEIFPFDFDLLIQFSIKNKELKVTIDRV